MAAYKRHDGEAAAWRSRDVGGKDGIAFDLGPRHVAALKDDLRRAVAKGIARDEIGRADFPLAPVADDIRRLRDTMVKGRGIVLIRGMPFENCSLDEIETMFWGLGTHFGNAVSQSVMGDRLGHVIDVTDVDPHARAYRARRELKLHTDLSDAIAFCSVRKAKAGGLSQFASALAVHDELLRSRPDLLAILYRGFRWHRFGEHGPSEEPVTPYRVPIFSERDGQVSCRYVRAYIREGAHALSVPLTAEEESALDAFDEVAARPDMHVEFLLEPGEVVFFNNLTVLHARTAFENAPGPDSKRLILRLWLAVPGGRPTAPEIQIYSTGPEGGVPQQAGRMPTFEQKALGY
ncbi:MAG: TauD/TfdA family dioxygenase [Alphaproteobacteria bacterium]